MTDEEKIIENIKLLGRGLDKCFIATVTNNYPDKDFIEAKDLNGVLYPDVRKRASLSDSKHGLLITPASGSFIIISRIGESDELFISMFSEIESIVIDGGEHEGIVIAPELVSQLAKLTARVDGIIAAIKGGVPVAQDGGASLQQTIVAKLNALTDKENFSNIQNEKIKH